MNQVLKHSICHAQNKCKQFADQKRREVNFHIGDLVFLKLQPYRQLSVAVRKHLKLSHKYYGPYKVLEKVGNVAYKLDLPADSMIHPVFHVSVLKKKVGPNRKISTALPKLGSEGQFLVFSVKIL